METATLCCSGPTLSPPLSRSGGTLLRAFKSSSSPISSLALPSAPSLAPHVSIFSVASALAKFECLPALAAEEALGSPLSSLSSSSAAEAASRQVSESAGASSAQSALDSAVQASAKADAAADGLDGNLIISILGTLSLVGLTLLTIGVVYLAVSDFLEKRKSDEEAKKLNEEEASAKPKRSGSLTAASRGPAKGFGKKREEKEKG